MTEDIIDVKKSAPMARNEAERPRAIGWRLPSLSRRPYNAYHPGRPSSSFGMSEPVIAQALEPQEEETPQTETPQEFIGAPIDIVGGSDDKCPICFEDFSESETDGNETIQCNVCRQNYHYNCIREWCVSGTHIGCPTCRDTDICKNNDLNPEPPSIANMANERQSIANIVNSEVTAHSRFFIIEQDSLFERAQQINNLDTDECRGIVLYILNYYISLEESRNNSVESTIRLDNARIFQQEVRGNLEWFTTPRLEDSLDIRCLWDMYALMMNIYNEYIQLQEFPQLDIWQHLISRQQRNVHKKRNRIRRKLRNFQRDIFSFGRILVKRENFSIIPDGQDGGAGYDLTNSLHKLHILEKRVNELSKSIEPLLKEYEIKEDEMKGGTNNIVSRTVNMDTKYVNNRRGPFSS